VCDVAGSHAQSGCSSQDQSVDHTGHTASSSSSPAATVTTTVSQNAGELNGVPADGMSQESTGIVSYVIIIFVSNVILRGHEPCVL